MTTNPPPESSTDKFKRLAASESKPKPEAESEPTGETPPDPEATLVFRPEERAAQPESPPPDPDATLRFTPDELSPQPGLPPEASPDSQATPVFKREELFPPQPTLPAEPEPSRQPPAAAPSALRNLELDEYGMPRLSKKTEPKRPLWPFDDEETLAPPPSARVTFPPPDLPSDEELFAEAPTVRRGPAQGRGGWAGCLWRVFVNGLIAAFFGFLVVVIILTYGYWSIARTLPPVGDLKQRASQFETTRVYDARGNLLYEIVDPQAGRRTHVPLNKISPDLIAATIATEDKNFYAHPGFDPLGILRAIIQNLQSGETVSGASTITQQLVRALVLTPEERGQRTALRKIREIILAAEIERTYSKDDILELYLNEVYYGNLAYGVEAAAETYFSKPASDLNLAEASFLAGLPQSPAVYDVYTNREAVVGLNGRQWQVVSLMLELGCIPVSTRTEPVCITADDATNAILEINNRQFTPPKTDARFPHWVNYVRQTLEDQYGAQTIYRSGFNVFTTLDPDLQTLAEQAVAEQVAALADRNVTNGALVALRPTTGEIVAMVGSDDYDDPKDGQINMALRPRQPGSSIKPLTYALSFEKGWTPATLIWDVPTEFPDGANPPYKPVNYDGRFHGPTLVRYALANSYNIPAVKTLQFVGIYGEGAFIPFAERFGITTFTRQDYGLALTLGGGEVSPLQLTGAYAALANGGRRVFPVAILKITDQSGKAICQQPLTPSDLKSDPPACQTPPDHWGDPVVSAETAFLISDILSDNAARTPAFGPNSVLRLSFPAAAKTGTTNDFRDNWTMGYTPNLAVGVWVGNADFTPMAGGTSGVTGAAPIWRTFMEGALGGGSAAPFVRPSTIVEKAICGISGAEPSEFCPPDSVRPELFDPNHLPPPREQDLWQKIFLDPFTGLRQTAECARAYQNDQLYAQEKLVIAVSDPSAQKWLTEDPNGQAWAAAHNITLPIAWAPAGQCTPDSPRPIVSFAYPPEGATLTAGPIQILGQAAATQDFDHFIVEYGLGHDPLGWGAVMGPNTNPFPETGRLADWDLSPLEGPVTLRIIVFSKTGGTAEARVRFTVQRPTPSPTPTETTTATPLDTATPTATPTASATPALSPTPPPPPTASETPIPSDTPIASPTDTPAVEPTPTPTETATP